MSPPSIPLDPRAEYAFVLPLRECGTEDGRAFVCDAYRSYVGSIVDEKARAKIILACNAHGDMLAALEEALEFLAGQEDVVDGDYGFPAPNKAMQLATTLREAIAKADGRS